MSPTKLGAYSAGFPGPPDRQGRIPAAVRKEACRPGSCAGRREAASERGITQERRCTSVTPRSQAVGDGASLLRETAPGSTDQLGAGSGGLRKDKLRARTRGWGKDEPGIYKVLAPC